MWLTLAFTSAALLGFYDAAKKQSLTGNAVLPVLLLNTLFSALFLLPMIVSLMGACVFRIFWVMTAFAANRTMDCLMVSYPVSWALTFLTHLVCLVIMMRRLYRREGVVSKHHHLTHRHTA